MLAMPQEPLQKCWASPSALAVFLMLSTLSQIKIEEAQESRVDIGHVLASNLLMMMWRKKIQSKEFAGHVHVEPIN
jgi:hypothetical protein